MRGSDQAFASESDGENSRESGEFPRVPAEKPPEGSELESRTALGAPDRDPENIAFRLWNEGRADEAIAFLEREIAAERGRHRDAALVPATGPDMRPVEPASDWRERHKTALTKADFNAFGAAVHTIDVSANPTDTILAHRANRPSRRTWIMALIVAAGFGAAGLAVWAPPGDRELAGVADTTPEPIPQELAAVTESAAVEDPRDSAQPAAGSALAPDAEVIEAPPPETEVVETPPPNPDALAELPPPPAGAAPTAPADDTASTTTLPAELTSEPQTTASISPDPLAEEQAKALEAPLPRPRPEPSPEIVAALNAEPPPDVIPEPPVTGANVVPDVVPVYGPNGVRIYRPVRRLAGAPQRLPPVDPFFHPALTPAEYQALLERRAWAQHYAAQRRAGAAPRIITLP